MIRKVTIDYRKKHSPGTLIITCRANGKIIYDRDGANHKLLDRQKKTPAARTR